MATEEAPLFPFSTPIAGEALVTPRWRRWFLLLRQAVDLTPIAVPTEPYLDQTASLATTSIDGGSLGAGLYSVSWYMAVKTAAGVSSSATVTVGWVELGVTKSYTGAAMTGNTTSTTQVNERALFYSDAASPITVSVAYLSTPANAMHYDLRPVLQSVATAS